MEKVTIQIDSKWVRRVKSPLMLIVGTLQGVSITFAPLFLYWSGTGSFHPNLRWIVVPLCFASIVLVGGFYIWLGGAVVRELRKQCDTATS
jgi:hypothetical protein